MTPVLIQSPNDDLIGVWNWDIRRDRFRGSSRIYRYLGIDPATAAFGVHISAVSAGVYADDRDVVSVEVDRAIHGHGRIDLHFRTLSDELGLRHVRSRGRVFRDPTNVPLFLCGFLLDTTGDRQRQAQGDLLIDHLLAARSLSDRLAEPELSELIDAVLLFAARQFGSRDATPKP